MASRYIGEHSAVEPPLKGVAYLSGCISFREFRLTFPFSKTLGDANGETLSAPLKPAHA